MKTSVLGLLLTVALQGDFEAVFQRGLDLAQSGRYLEAVECFREAHRLAPEEAAVLYNLGSLLERLGQTAEAIDVFREAARLSPDQTSIQIALGEALYRTGRARESIAPLATAARGAAPPPDALIALAKAYEAEGEFALSIETLARYVDLRAEDVEARILLGEQLAAQKRYDEAVATWRRGLAQGRLEAELHYRIGEALSRIPANAVDAESSLRQALALDPTHVASRVVLARLLARARRAEEGLDVLLTAFERHPGSPDVQFVLANLYQQLGDLEEAEAARARFQSLSSEAERREQHDARVHVTYKRARDLLDSGRMPEAKREFTAVLELDPSNALARSMLAKLAFSQGKLDEARRWISDALRHDPSQGEFHYLSALFAARSGEVGEAERSARRCLELLPGFTDAWLLLGVLLTDSGRVEQGIDSFLKAEALEPRNPTVYLNLASAYEKAGENGMAAEAMERYREVSEKR